MNKKSLIIKIDGVNINDINFESQVSIKGQEELTITKSEASPEMELAENEVAVEVSGVEKGLKYAGLTVIFAEELEAKPVKLPVIHLPTDEQVAMAADFGIEGANEMTHDELAKHLKVAEKEAAKAAKTAEKEAAKAKKMLLKEAKKARVVVEEEMTDEQIQSAIDAAYAAKADEDEAAAKAKKEKAEKPKKEKPKKEIVKEEIVEEEVVQLSVEEIRENQMREAIQAEKELGANWLKELAQQEEETASLEKQLKNIEVQLAQAVDTAEEAEALYNKEAAKAADLKEEYNNAKSLSDQAHKSANEPELAEAVKEKLDADAEEALKIANKAKDKFEKQQEVANEANAKLKEAKATVNSINQDSTRTQKAIQNSIKTELRIKDRVIINLSNKGSKANSLTKTAWKLEDQASLAEHKANNGDKEVKKLTKKTEKALAAIEPAEISASKESDDEKRQILEAEIAQLRTKASNAGSAQAKAEKKSVKLRTAANKAANKSDNATFLAELANAVALVAQEAARKVQNMIIDELEGRVHSPEITELEKETLTQEIIVLKESAKQEVALNEELDRPRFIIADDMKFTEKWVKGNYRKTYWIIFERGYRSRDEEFERFLEEQKEERERILADIREKQEAAARQIEAEKEAAAAELANIKSQAKEEARLAREKADKDLAEIKQKAADEKAAAEAEVAKAKAEGEALIASQKAELDAKLNEAENLVKENNAKNADIVKALEETIAALRKETESIPGLNEKISSLQAETNTIPGLNSKIDELSNNINKCNTNTSDLEARIRQLEADLEKSEKAKEIAEKKAAILAQIEEIVEEDMQS